MTPTRAQREEFQQRGVLRIPGFLPADRLRAAQEHVFSHFESEGIRKHGRWNLEAHDRIHTGSSRFKKGLKKSAALAALAGRETFDGAGKLSNA